MSKIIQKPLKCRNARCSASCCIADAQIWGDNPSKCPMFKYEPYIYDKAHDTKVRADAIEELKPNADMVAYEQGRLDAIEECIEYFSIHAKEVYEHISARDFICDTLEMLKENN